MIRTENLSFAYGRDRKILEGLSLSFAEDLNIIIGPNACGKSTLLKCLFGLLNYQGKIFWEDQDLSSLSLEERSKIMAYLPQGDVRNSSLTVFETVLLGKVGSLGWKVKGQQLEEVYQLLDSMKLLPFYNKKIYELSGGQKKLVTIAQTLIREPQLILMDEPTNNLDIQKQLELFDMVGQIIEKKKIQFIMVLHDINLSLSYAHKLIVMSQGRGVSWGKPDQIISERMLREVYGIKSSLIEDPHKKPLVVAQSSVNTIDLFKEKAE
ncbi:MAG: ABC transporter ATP-binding protein [Tissierellia bacterium]|nr:ABC transporter ATP-binding protein [Tissierellia bacterium]